MDVTSFNVNHNLLKRGVYVSRIDYVGGDCVTTFDVRLKEPNREPAIDTAAIHTLEHLLAVYLRSDTGWADKTVYVGPMGCRTGFYIIFKGRLSPQDVLLAVTGAFEYAADFEGEIPAAVPEMCGNYLDHNPIMARWESRKFIDETLRGIKPENMEYP
jgi:S-ribosylhomocysteine lyase